jgi:hypothetical protein
MADQEYTGVHGVLLKDGSPFAVAEYSVKIKRGVASHARSGKWSDIKLPGKIDVTGSITRIMVNAEMLKAILTATPATGAAETLHAGLTCPGSGAESITDMTDTSIASASTIQLKALGGPITVAGTAILIGTDASGNEVSEVVAITTLAENSTVTSKRTFKTLTHVALKNVAMGAEDTLEVASIVGSSTATVSSPLFFDLVGGVEDGSNSVMIEIDDAFLTDGEFKFSDADNMLEEPLSFTMKDPDAGLRVI